MEDERLWAAFVQDGKETQARVTRWYPREKAERVLETLETDGEYGAPYLVPQEARV